MDTSSLVEGGAQGLQAVVEALADAGVHVEGAYLIRTAAIDGDDFYTRLRIVTKDDLADVVRKYVQLRRDGRLPKIAEEVSMSPVPPDHDEASRVLDYARRLGAPPLTIRGALWKGLYIEDAVVVRYPMAERIIA